MIRNCDVIAKVPNSVAELRSIYNAMDWSRGGEQWADRWGSSTVQWQEMILPRIARYLGKTRAALELGGGMGRLSRHLAGHCERLWVTEISERCHDGLQDVFRSSPHVRPMLTDGVSLSGIPEGSLDFVFSVFSLVHADRETLQAALHQIKPRLRANGVVFLHHSNAAALAGGDPAVDRKLGRYRSLSVSADTMRTASRASGLRCIAQEIFGWDTDTLRSDCFSVLTLPGSCWDQPILVTDNPTFCTDAIEARRRYQEKSDQS
ncbi:MAG: class I SAM-dependent methyltransferase [Pseudomonadota bacterium]